MKVLVIGGAGYLGTPLTQLFVSNRNPVICVDKLDHSNYDTIKQKFELSREFTKQFTDGKGEFIFVEDNIKNIDDYLPNFTGIERILYMASALVFSPYDSPEIVPTSKKYVNVCQTNLPKAPSIEIIPTRNKR